MWLGDQEGNQRVEMAEANARTPVRWLLLLRSALLLIAHPTSAAWTPTLRPPSRCAVTTRAGALSMDAEDDADLRFAGMANLNKVPLLSEDLPVVAADGDSCDASVRCDGGSCGCVILLRHGESVWNDANRFTGWYDVALSERGEQQAAEAAALLAESGLLCLDRVFTSGLKRTIKVPHSHTAVPMPLALFAHRRVRGR